MRFKPCFTWAGVALIIAFATLGGGMLVGSVTGQQAQQDAQSLDTLAQTAQSTAAQAQQAMQIASLPIVPILVGLAAGLGCGTLAGSIYAYQNRGLK